MANFDKIVDRRDTDSYKWDIKENELPMWVADMDFEVAPKIKEAIINRANKSIYGYNVVSEKWYEAYINWWKNEHGFLIQKEWMLFSLGVVPSLSSIVRRLTHPGEKVCILTPVYNIFFNSILNNGRFVLDCPLKYEGNTYEIDFLALENALKDKQCKLMIMCNPHNPVGKIFSKEDLRKVVDLCYKYDVKIISDEIHCDITLPDKKYNPLLSVSEKAKEIGIMLISPTKAFNIAGIQTSAIVIPNKNIKDEVERGINNDEIAEPNTFAQVCAIAAFNESKDWLNELKNYLYENRKLVRDFLNQNVKEVKLIESEATYLLWIDCSKIIENSEDFAGFLKEKTGLILSSGLEYGKNGRQFVRMNIATNRKNVLDGLNRFKKGVELYKK